MKQKLEIQDKIISSCHTICEGTENIKIIKEVLSKEQNRIAEEQAKVLDFTRQNTDQDRPGGLGQAGDLDLGRHDLKVAGGQAEMSADASREKILHQSTQCLIQ